MLNVRIEKPDRVISEKGEHVGTILSRRFRKKEIYCFICNWTASSISHYEKSH